MSTFEPEFNMRKLRRNGIINLMKAHPKVIKMCDKIFVVHDTSPLYHLYQFIPTKYGNVARGLIMKQLYH